MSPKVHANIMAKKKAVEKKTDENEPRFEESLSELQEIVRRLEDGVLGLDESMQQFEHGVKLLRQCYHVLDRAEQKIELLTRIGEDGIPVIEPFDATATTEKNEKAAGRRKRTSKTDDEESGGLF